MTTTTEAATAATAAANAKASVAKGAAFLDRVRPNWVDDIDLRTLDLSSSCQCVLGQIGHRFGGSFGTFIYSKSWDTPEGWKRRIPRGYQRLRVTADQSVEYGFEISGNGSMHQYKTLGREWKRVIKARLAERQLVDA